MRVVVQRVSEAKVEVDGKVLGTIGHGLLVYVGIEKGDGEREAAFMAEKILNLRIFPDDQDRMNVSVRDVRGEILSISQFTLASRIRKGRRPDFNNAEDPSRAEPLYRFFNDLLSREVVVATGEFGAMMRIFSINEGPVTFIVEKNYGTDS
jgi:D-tyrosyl-tRNA(Tyr) deacylase